MNWDSSFENFKNYLKLERGLSINSIKSYEYDLNLFKNFIQSNQMSDTPFNCRPETVKNYLYNTNIFHAKKRNFPLKINMLENHPFSSQVFLPFNATVFLVLVAPIGNKPKIDLIEIFKVSGGDGINFNPKVWHFPLISLENEKYITIDKKDADNNIEIYNFEQSEIFELNYE